MSVDVCTFLWLLAASLFTLKHARATWRACSARGASSLATAFFTTYAAWSIYFFAVISQPWSCAGSVALFLAHAFWLHLQIRYRESTLLSLFWS